jgi:hypothetical protein
MLDRIARDGLTRGGKTHDRTVFIIAVATMLILTAAVAQDQPRANVIRIEH